jgi:hypothetical protein
MIQLKNCWTDLDEIWYGHSAIGVYPEITPFKFPTIDNTKMADVKICDEG